VEGEIFETYPGLREIPGLVHGFTLRRAGVDVCGERAAVLGRLQGHLEEAVQALGYKWDDVATGEQVHGAETQEVGLGIEPKDVIPGVDALMTDREDILLGVFVADCAAVYLVDQRRGAIGLAHSGNKGTELGIVPGTIEAMGVRYGTDVADLIVQVSPCIRPPAYEIDFAGEIRKQCEAVGVKADRIYDEGISTADDLGRYYSYRVERGKTGRMLALLGKRAGFRGDD
jgi:copper oxidase (laccase) domain-containing protein